MPSGSCPHCGCTDIDADPSRGDEVCTNCGTVLRDNIIVSEVQFVEGSYGNSQAIGQLVTADGHVSGLNLGYHHGMAKESRAITLNNAHRKIKQLGHQLKLNEHCIETACNFYKMALCRNMTRGRRNSHVIAACVYIVCRKEGTPHMLLDLSDHLQVNVYDLGRTYLKMSKTFCINLPAIDPCLYILRFAHRLDFGNKTHDVSMTALRLVQRMKRDWMHTGRRPSGLCGAALLVAARLHNFSRTLKDLIRVVKVCHATLRKRLKEFGETPSSKLTLDEFMTIDLEEEQDPPSFKAARRKKLQQMEQLQLTDAFKQIEEHGQNSALTEEVSQVQKMIEEALEEKAKKHGSPYAKYAESPEKLEEEAVLANEFVVDETMETISNCIHDSSENADEETLNNIMNPNSQNHDNAAAYDVFRGPRPTAASLGLKRSIAECMQVEEEEDGVEELGELDLEGLDDDELDAYIMSDAEAKVKTELWMQINAEYLKEMKEKEERKAKEEEENANKPEKKTRKRLKRQNQQESNTAGEAIEKMLQQKKISCKINYDVLRNLNDPFNSSQTEESTDHSKDEQKLQTTSRSRLKTPTPVKGGAPPSSIRGVMSSIVKGSRFMFKNS